MNYRQATPNDFPRLAQMRWDFRTALSTTALAAETKDAFIPVMLEFLEHAYQSGQWVMWLAEEEGEIVSHVYIERIRKVPRPTSFDCAYGYLTNMYTVPAWRGKGIGAELLQYAVKWAREQKLEMIILWPAKGREAFYQRGGFIHEPEAMSQELE